MHQISDSSSSLIKPPKEETPNIDCNYVEINPELGFDMIGDGFCDDFLNNDACWFDLGDCCILDEDSLAYCNECECYMATATIPSDWITPLVSSQKPEIISCAALNYIDEKYLGDGYCDDILNHGNCTFDGGDCCLDNLSTDYCTTCTCLETISCKIMTFLKFQKMVLVFLLFILVNSEACENEAWIGDVICDDGNNNLECHFDGGDCCYGENTQTDLCTECECKEAVFNIPKLKYS